MIARERPHAFIMIEQDDHARISGEIANKWCDDHFIGDERRASVLYAIYMHDFGWKAFDKQPFWNDKQKAPYTFIDFPTPAKIILYKHGIDAVEQVDPYAALLCSEHYKRFLLNDFSEEARLFVNQERERQQRIIGAFTAFDEQGFDFHYGLLQLCDNLSLYMCLNEPNVTKEDVHPFFHGGIPLSPALPAFDQSNLQLSWKDERTIEVREFPFSYDLPMKLKQKTIQKESIKDNGLIEAYKSAPVQTVSIQLISGN